MEILSNRKEKIFRKDFNGKPIYKIGISHKNQDGTYTNSTMLCRLPKGTDLHHKTYIKIKQAWLDFYTVKKEKNGKQKQLDDYKKLQELNQDIQKHKKR